MIGDDFEPSNFGFVGNSAEEQNVLAPGGITFEFQAGAALLVGDVVYFDAATGKVLKSATTADYQKFAGVVVGGAKTFGRVITRKLDVGIAAAALDELVIVQHSGKAWVVAAAAVARAGQLTVVTTAGRVDDAAGATQGQIIGYALEAATNAGDVILALISHR